MENFRGTKGEWHNNGAEVRSQSGLLIGYAYTHLEVNQSLEERNANARLIASAPELLELCQLVYNSFGGGNVITFNKKDIQDFERVINKSLGL